MTNWQVYDSRDNYPIDTGLTLERATEMLRYYVARDKHCTYGIRQCPKP